MRLKKSKEMMIRDGVIQWNRRSCTMCLMGSEGLWRCSDRWRGCRNG